MNSAQHVRVIGQHPARVEQFDDKQATNALLRSRGLNVAASTLVDCDDLSSLQQLELPVVVKPVRGRGSAGVSVEHSWQEAQHAVNALLLGEAAAVDDPQTCVFQHTVPQYKLDC